MSIAFPSQEWCSAYKDAINANNTYRTAGRSWTFGAVVMIVKAAPELGIATDAAMWLDLKDGQCHGCNLVDLAKTQDASFVIVGEYPQWKRVIRGELDPTKALMQGQLKLTKGHMPTMVRFVHASKELVVSSARVPTRFPDENRPDA